MPAIKMRHDVWEDSMAKPHQSWPVDRRTILKTSAALAAVQFASPFIIKARGETPVRIGMVDPITGVYAAIAQGEVVGAKFAAEEINKKGGILGRPVELLIEDSANDVGTGVQKTRKLIERDQVSFIVGDVNSGIAIAMAQVTNEKKVLHIVSGGHTDPITGTNCSWNVFRVCNSTTMDANAIGTTLIEKFGKKWYFLTPDYAYGHSVQAGFEKLLKAAGGTSAGSLVPLGTPDYSAYLIQAKAYGPQVLINVMGGGDQVSSLKQFVRFGQANGCRWRLVRARKHTSRARWRARRMVDDGMVVGSAGRAACRGIQCLDQENYRRRGHGAQLVRLCVDPDAGGDCESREDARRPKAGACAFRIQTTTADRLAAGCTGVSRRRPRVDEYCVRRRGAPAQGRSRQYVHDTQSGAR
jgi:ABC-type branched-subunit amino acid transport system substrate-binding protein